MYIIFTAGMKGWEDKHAETRTETEGDEWQWAADIHGLDLWTLSQEHGTGGAEWKWHGEEKVESVRKTRCNSLLAAGVASQG